ncbi:YtzI protein [Virgibacillus doumboii]|uniref:YtzI protein n=1 Tax=Virgibacillus doumboii TaxID=2697503 RepID=UPI0013DF419A|nr:YtzI protein [Virgibacillus doumboii]
MITIIIIAIAIMLAVLAFTLIAISKGYDYKHSIDPLPENDTDDQQMEKDHTM